MKHNISIFFACFLWPLVSVCGIDLILYSYDRPIQLYALLESLEVYTSGVQSVQVVYRVSSQAYQDGYSRVWGDFPHVRFYCQGQDPHRDFKKLTMHALEQCLSDYILFAVDDNLVKDYIDFDCCVELMEHHNAYGFYLKMGKNLDYCYSRRLNQPLPRFIVDDGRVCTWRFKGSSCDWYYPNTLDMTIYRKSDVIQDFLMMNFIHPNHIEGIWGNMASEIMHKSGICFVSSKIVNVPLNKVQDMYDNRHMNYMSPAELLSIFKEEKKIDIRPLHKIENSSVHIEYIPTFVDRLSSL